MLPFLEEVVLPMEAGRLDYRLLVVVVAIVAVGSVLELVAVGWLEQQPFAVVVEAFAAEEQFVVQAKDLPSDLVALEIGCNPIPMTKVPLL